MNIWPYVANLLIGGLAYVIGWGMGVWFMVRKREREDG